MTAENLVVARILREVAAALDEGTQGPCDYWYRRLAERLRVRADRALAYDDGSDYGEHPP